MRLFGDVYNNRTVLITGHTGFKGSWLALWLRKLGANVIGYALNPPSTPNHYDLLKPDIVSLIGDIRDSKKLQEFFLANKPEIVFHLAAQPLVRYSYKNPVETFETNVIGTINVFEACRQIECLRAVVNITSDKCYENKEWVWGYRENDRMGGHDPYSASKSCAELVANCYRRSFFTPSARNAFNPSALLSSARAGNVIGGGDWAEDRLIPDIMRAVSRNEKVVIRNPRSTRPWQHVLEPLSGYLALGQKLLEGDPEFADGWNFGPNDESNIDVETVVRKAKECWNKIEYSFLPPASPSPQSSNPHEAGLLKLDCSKARSRLNWKPVWDIDKTVFVTARWYKKFYESGSIISPDDLSEYIDDAAEKNLLWTKQAADISGH
ncbi:MAG: CDP-glucose 4,6-dehydratase [Nitrospirae bacterium]|nr:CDP-glucose 4,6-dehydratase [Nitrospirota bacterium]